MGNKCPLHARATQPDPTATLALGAGSHCSISPRRGQGPCLLHCLHAFQQRHLLFSGAEAHGRLQIGGPGSCDWALLQGRLGNEPLVSTLRRETHKKGNVPSEGRSHRKSGAVPRLLQLLPQPDKTHRPLQLHFTTIHTDPGLPLGGAFWV